MLKVGILSDTHGTIPSGLFSFFESCDELWHAGDWGNIETVKALEDFKPVRGVYGNIDSQEIRSLFPLVNTFEVESVKVCMSHIGGYPGKYNPAFRSAFRKVQPDLVICGHSHILRVMKDQQENCMFFNPGAAGKEGFHKVCTALRLRIEGKRLFDLEVWETKK